MTPENQPAVSPSMRAAQSLAEAGKLAHWPESQQKIAEAAEIIECETRAGELLEVCKLVMKFQKSLRNHPELVTALRAAIARTQPNTREVRYPRECWRCNGEWSLKEGEPCPKCGKSDQLHEQADPDL